MHDELLGSLWDFIKAGVTTSRPERRRSEGETKRDRVRGDYDAKIKHSYEVIDEEAESRSPARLAKDLLQVIQETVFFRKIDDKPKTCPLVTEESDLSGSDEEPREQADGSDRRIANLIDFFFSLVKSQKNDDDANRMGSNCFRSEPSPEEERINRAPTIKPNEELEQKMETLMDFLAKSGCMESEKKKRNLGKPLEKKITLMEFLFGPTDVEKHWHTQIIKPVIEIYTTQRDDEANILNKTICISNSNVGDISFIDETPVEDGNETLVEMLLKYMDNYNHNSKFKEPTKSISITPSIERSKSEITIHRLETSSDLSKTKSDSSLTRTLDTVIDRFEELKLDKTPDRRVSESAFDFSNVKQDLGNILNEAVDVVEERRNSSCCENDEDVFSEQEDLENYNKYTKEQEPVQYIQYLPYSGDLSDIIEEEELSSHVDRTRRHDSHDEQMLELRLCAQKIIKDVEMNVTKIIKENRKSTEDVKDECSGYIKKSLSMIDLRLIPDLPPSFINAKSKAPRIDKSTSTDDITESITDRSRSNQNESSSMTEETSLFGSSSCERVLVKMESLQKFFSKSRLDIIDETAEENRKSPKLMESANLIESASTEATGEQAETKAGQESLDDVEDIQEDVQEIGKEIRNGSQV